MIQLGKEKLTGQGVTIQIDPVIQRRTTKETTEGKGRKMRSNIIKTFN